jgi:transglutaminase-like putative cysteine protease
MQRFEAVERFFELSLLGLVAAGFLAVAGSGFLDLPTIVLVGAGLLLRGLLVLRIIRLEIPDRLINIITVSYIGFFVLDYFRLSGRLLEATVHLVCFLAVMKILTARTNRDFMYTAAISLMELVAAAMLSNNLSFFAYLALYLIFGIAAFTSAEMRRALAKPGHIAGSANTRVSLRLALLTGFVTAGILIMTTGLFIVLPRTANAAFRHMIPSRYHLTGFSSVVSLGQVGEIQKDTRPVMHIKQSPYSTKMPADLKWRGAALTHFDGKRWTDLSVDGRVVLPTAIPLNLADEAQRSRRDGHRLVYRVDLSTTDTDALFIAGIPEWLNIDHARVIRTATDGYRLGLVPSEMVRYEISSFVPNGLPAMRATLTAAQQRRYLQLPALDPRISELARGWAGDGPLLDQAAKVQHHLKTEFAYSLELLQSPAPDPLADFLFERKKGHCEYFASAMTVMLRSLGMPARIVNGFQSGTYNSVSEMYVIRSSDAHSWVEAFDPAAGWVTFDPTPSAPRSAGNWILTRASFYLDAAESFWQDWVVNYDLDRQISLAGKLDEKTRGIHWGWHPPDWKGWKDSAGKWGAKWGSAAFASAALLALFFFAYRMLPGWLHTRKLKTGRISAADATVLYGKMLSLVKRRGFQKPPWFTAGEFAATLPDSELANCVNEFTEGYQALRFGGDAQVAGRLAGILDRMQQL